ncbi:CAZyme family AA11 [Penicillium angulare]|uniref:CAZyme family AA11 n=1 Tax=Penicillium angulare TaxID=116970 RepID=UPI0025419421|nr:CAZyme family AA11 [Penicillium angulare]KAJ5267309.1 CAZyme family AA11 [Penicillium angulare]
MFLLKAVSIIMAVGWASGHMILNNPKPFGKATLNNSPLAADGSDFPCKLRPGAFEAPEEQNIVGVGETHPLSFEGGAMHGGGSCQVSLTIDRIPSKDSEWLVIKSFEGGCPASTSGSIGSSSAAVDPFHFNFTVPESMKPGDYTLAWTWFNQIGNREMYMNCAPITITGLPANGSQTRPSFPPMFIANINGCNTTENVDIRFPHPGNALEYNGDPAKLAPLGLPACTGVPLFGDRGVTALQVPPTSGSHSSSPVMASAAPSWCIARPPTA